MNIEIPKGWRELPDQEIIRHGDKLISIIGPPIFADASVGYEYNARNGVIKAIRPDYLPVQITAVSPHKP
jgi:hypothetical protein